MANFGKGFYGVNYRTVFGLQRNIGSTVSAQNPGDPAWDLWVGPLPFLLASSPERTYVRETAPVRRERFDQSRDPGENSLDSGLWIRSFTSWHLGAGQEYAEPLETDPDIARFRFADSVGVDPWTPGELGLQPSMELLRSDVVTALATPKNGVVFTTDTGVFRRIDGSTNSAGLNTDVTRLACGQGFWLGITQSGTVVYNNYAGLDAGTVSGLTGATAIGYQKNRFWVGAGSELYELVDVKATPQALFHTFLGDAEIIDIDAGASDVYVMVEEGLTTIYAITAQPDGSLSAPVAVATLPRGERGRYLYGYLGRYLAVATDKGIRIADSGQSGVLPVGPLTIEIPGGPHDVTADGNFLWVTSGEVSTFRTDPDDPLTAVPGTFRVDLSREVDRGSQYGDSAASRFAYASDQYADAPGGSFPVALTTYGGQMYLVLSSGQMWVTSETDTVASGWLETGVVSFSTAEAKAWQSVVIEAAGEGFVSGFADTGAGWSAVTQSPLRVPLAGDATFDTFVHPPANSINLRMLLTAGISGTPLVRSAGLRALPAPKRNRYIRLPLLAFDQEVDRHNSPIGYEGFAFDRVRDLELLEEEGKIVQVLDNRTGETLSCQIDRVSFSSATPPDRARPNWGGVVMLTLLAV